MSYSRFYIQDLKRLLYNARKSLPWWKQKTPKNIAKYIWHSEDNLAQYAKSLLKDSVEKYKFFNLERPFDEKMLVKLISNAYKQVGKNPDDIAKYIWYSEDNLAQYATFLLIKT